MPVPGISSDGKKVTYGRYTFAWPEMMTVAPDVAREIVEKLPQADSSVCLRRLGIPRPLQYASIAEYPTESRLRSLLHQ